MTNSDLHSRVLQWVYDRFREHATWPSARELEFTFADEGDIEQIAHEIGTRFIHCDNLYTSAPECYLTLAGVARCEGADADVERFIQSIKIFAEAYRNPDVEITTDRLAAEFGLDDFEAKRLSQLIWTEGHLSAGGTGRADGWKSFRPSRRAFQMRKISSLEEYLEARYPASEPLAALHTSSGYATEDEEVLTTDYDRLLFPSIELEAISNLGLRAVLEADLAELEVCYRNQAWKSVGMLAGSCCEAILIDIIGRDCTVIPEKKRDQWENLLGLRELTRYASDGHLISPEGNMVVNVIKQWRDLVHPWRAKDHRFPSPAIARTMLAFLGLLVEDLRRLGPVESPDTVD
jgi:hypothetical protein